MKPDVRPSVYQTKVSTTPLYWSGTKPIPKSDGRVRCGASSSPAPLSMLGDGGQSCPRSLTSFASVVASPEKRLPEPSRQRADAGGDRARARRRRVPVLGCVPCQDVAWLRGNADRGRSRRVLAASRVEWTVDFPKVSTRVLWMARNPDDNRAAAAWSWSG